MKADIVIRAKVDTGKDSIRCAQWIAEEIRDYALRTLGVYHAECRVTVAPEDDHASED